MTQPTTRILEIKAFSKFVDSLSEALWELPGVLGIEEQPVDGPGFFQVGEEFEVLEFGSDAAKKCADFLDKQRFRGRGDLILKVYIDPALFGLAKEKLQSLQEQGFRFELLQDTELKNIDYLDEYKKNVRGVSVGENLWVGPPWDQAPADKISFIVEPGLAFGTGDHPTTQLCLLELEKLSSTEQFKSILDLGTGTGVLALAAQKFFPQAKLMVSDLDPQCEFEVQKTFGLNHQSLQNIQAFYGPQGSAAAIRKHGHCFDLIISNIYAEVLASLTPDIRALLNSKGLWLVSGVLEGLPENKLLDAAERAGFRVLSRDALEKTTPQFNGKEGLLEETEVWVKLCFQRGE